jgi:cytochrome c oxidase cbb3-type subunit III
VLGAAVALVPAMALQAARTFAAQDDEKAAKDTAAVERGQKTFQQSCGFCHGADATGARGPDLVRSQVVAHDVKGDLIGPVILQGRPDKGMPPLSLTEEQIRDVAAFLHSRGDETLASARVPKTYALEKMLTGNAEAGKAYFDGAGGCTKCHSATGDLANVAGRYPPIELEAHMLYPDVPHSRTAVITLPSGEQIAGTVEHVDDWVIGVRDSSGWYHSFSRAKIKADIQDRLAAHRELLDKISQSEVHNLFAYLATLKQP